MPEQRLKTNLTRLRQELEDPARLDDATREQLIAVAATIERVLEQNDPDYAEAHASIQDTALEFEARHPRFARILTDITDALAKLGI